MSWSLSKIGTYEKCPAQYKYRYIDHIPTKKSESAQRGTDNHAVIEGYLKGHHASLPSELSFYTGFFDGLKKFELFPEIQIALDNEWNPVPWDSPTVWWRGVLDLLTLPNEQEAYVYDWKTGKFYPDHDDQKSLYSLAVLATYPAVRLVRAFHVYVDLGKTSKKEYSRDQMHMLRDFWTNRVVKLERDSSFIPHPGWYCSYCPFSRAQGGPCKF